MNEPIHFRPVTAADVPALAVMERLCFSQPWTENMLRGELGNPNADILLALQDEALLGYIGIQCIAGECSITNLAVHPDFRGRGLGLALLRIAQETALRCDCFALFLEVREGNTSARGLYEKFGLHTVGRRKNYYALPIEDALIMTKQLGENI